MSFGNKGPVSLGAEPVSLGAGPERDLSNVMDAMRVKPYSLEERTTRARDALAALGMAWGYGPDEPNEEKAQRYAKLADELQADLVRLREGKA